MKRSEVKGYTKTLSVPLLARRPYFSSTKARPNDLSLALKFQVQVQVPGRTRCSVISFPLHSQIHSTHTVLPTRPTCKNSLRINKNHLLFRPVRHRHNELLCPRMQRCSRSEHLPPSGFTGDVFAP